jgi:hypothetical protein
MVLYLKHCSRDTNKQTFFIPDTKTQGFYSVEFTIYSYVYMLGRRVKMLLLLAIEM